MSKYVTFYVKNYAFPEFSYNHQCLCELHSFVSQSYQTELENRHLDQCAIYSHPQVSETPFFQMEICGHISARY